MGSFPNWECKLKQFILQVFLYKMQRRFLVFVFHFYQIIGSVMTIGQDRTARYWIANFFNPFKGRHLKISGQEVGLGFRLIRNSTGHIIQMKGVAAEMVDWMSINQDFEYSALQVNSTLFDETAGRQGLVNFIMRGELDIAVHISLTPSRVSLVDFSHPTLHIPISFMIPKPHLSVDLTSAIKPFQASVWGIILVAIFTVIIALYFLSLLSRDKRSYYLNINNKSVKRENEKMPDYVLGILLEQGGSKISNKTPVRLLFSIWCISCFIITNYYDSLLTSYLSAPNPQPLIKSIHEIRTRPEIRLLIEKGLNLDIYFSTATSGFSKEIGDRLRKFDPSSRCSPNKKCVELVKEGNTVYVGGREASLAYGVKADMIATGKCNVDLGKERFMNLKVAWTMKKNSPYTDIVNRGVMRMREAGFLKKWYDDNSPDVHQCINDNNKKDRNQIEPLSVDNLAGAFICLLIGFTAALFLFLLERVLNYVKSHVESSRKC